MMVEENIELICGQHHQSKEPSELSEVRKKVDFVLSKCSCLECDSLHCFKLRHGQYNNLCNCSKKSLRCCSKLDKSYRENETEVNLSLINEINKSVDICSKVSNHEIFNSENSTIDIINSNCESQDSYRYQESLSDVKIMINSPLSFNENRANLSAQIMKAGYIHDISDCVSFNESYKETVKEVKDIKEYIYTKLKEIYNACSCKVCECIPTTPLFATKGICSCKPCQCDDCEKLYHYFGNHLKEKTHSGCPCIRCDRKDCRAITKLNHTCKCKPCDCLKCTETNFNNCKCVPCSCLECKYRPFLTQSFVVAAVNNHMRDQTCDCDAPCECSNCIPTYGTTATSQERSAGTVSRSICPCNPCTSDSCQSNGESCTCRIQKHVMSKPIERGHHDYDIRSVLLDEHSIMQRNLYKDVISMHPNVQKFCIGDDPSYCRRAKIHRYDNLYKLSNFPSDDSISNSSNNTGDYFDCGGIEPSKSQTLDMHPLQNIIANYCCCEFCERQHPDSIKCCIENIIQNYILPNDRISIVDEICPTTQTQSKLICKKDISEISLESKQNMPLCVQYTKINNTLNDLNGNVVSNNSARNLKINKKSTELSLSQRKKLYCVASILKNLSLFSEGSNSPCRDDSKYSASLKTLLPVNQLPLTLNDAPEKISNSEFESWSAKNNFSTLQYFDKLYDENQSLSRRDDAKIKMTNFDYAKIQTTLNEAQDFSVKLKNILETYEAANKNFRSVTHRLRILYEEIVKDKTKEDNRFKVHFKHNNDINETYLVGDTQTIPNESKLLDALNVSLTTCHSSNSNKTSLKPILGSHNLLENVEWMKSNTGVQDNSNVFGDARLASDAVSDILNEFHNQKGSMDFFNKSQITLKTRMLEHKLSQLKIDKYTEIDFSYIKPKLVCKSTSAHDKRQPVGNLNTELKFKDADFYKDNETDTNLNGLYQYFQQIVLQTMNKLKNPAEARRQSFNVLRKNIYLHSHEKNLNDNISHPDIIVKAIIELISKEINKGLNKQEINKGNTINRRNNLKNDLYENVRTILDNAVSKAVIKSELTVMRHNSMVSTPNLHLDKSKSYVIDKQKASFSELKRISDHTVLVKWNIPQNITNIRGYELQVDGRAVKKIISPHCAMAVITCLPHSERVLLTILTLTDSEGPYNSNTTVYHPRNRK